MEYETLTGEEIQDVLPESKLIKIKTLRYRKKNVPKRLYRNCKPMFQAADRQAVGSSITWFCIKQPAFRQAVFYCRYAPLLSAQPSCKTVQHPFKNGLLLD